MKRILLESWTRIKFVFGVSFTAVIVSLWSLIFGVEKGLSILVQIFQKAGENIGHNE